MRCPKCHYLSFEPEPRCKNCGYDLDLPDADLELRAAEAPDGPMADLALRDFTEPAKPASLPLESMRREREVMKAPSAPRVAVRVSASAVALEPPPAPVRRPASPPAPALRSFEPPRRISNPVARVAEPVSSPARVTVPEPVIAPEPAIAAAPSMSALAAGTGHAVRATAPVTTELPLFVKGLQAASVEMEVPALDAGDEETPLVTLPAEPRAPLAVRRHTPEISAPKARTAAPAPARKLGPLDRDLLEDLQRIERNERREAAVQAGEPMPIEAGDDAGAGKRVAAAAIDATILGSISVAVLWVTLRWIDLSIADAGVLPVVPTTLFLLLVALGYLLMFTAAGGQTLGKMALGLRVVGEGAEAGVWTSLTAKQVLYRSALALPSMLALVGFLPALVGDHRALHDRLSHTRVVRA